MISEGELLFSSFRHILICYSPYNDPLHLCSLRNPCTLFDSIRSSFRTGAPPPPRPVKEFYDKLFWFGFDPDSTRPTDRTMFGGTRGKFNAVDLLRDREERQRYYRGSGYDDNDGRRRRIAPSSRSGGRDSVIQDFGSVRDWNARKIGQGRTGGDAVGDDVVDRLDFDPRLDDGYFSLNDDIDDTMGSRGRIGQRRRDDRGGQRQRRRSEVDRRAEEYDRFIGLGPKSDDAPPPLGVAVDLRTSIPTTILTYYLTMESTSTWSRGMHPNGISTWRGRDYHPRFLQIAPNRDDDDDRGRSEQSRWTACRLEISSLGVPMDPSGVILWIVLQWMPCEILKRVNYSWKRRRMMWKMQRMRLSI